VLRVMLSVGWLWPYTTCGL